MAKKISTGDYPLTELHRSDFEVANGEPDIRGWKVIDAQSRILGEVVELIFDPLAQMVRYLVVHIDGKPINLISRDVLIPVGIANISGNEAEGLVSLPTITTGHLAELPTYKRSVLNYNFEQKIRQILTGSNAVLETGDSPAVDFYTHDHFNQNRFYTGRYTPGEQQIQPQRIIPKERDYSAANNSANRLDDNHFRPFRDGAIELTEHKEVPRVNKDVRVVEEVRVNKNISERDEIIRDNVRRTEVDIEKLPRRED